MSRACALAVLGMAGSFAAQADNLVDLYQAARGYDATYLAAKSQFDALQFKADQARSLQRPSVNMQATNNPAAAPFISRKPREGWSLS